MGDIDNTLDRNRCRNGKAVAFSSVRTVGRAALCVSLFAISAAISSAGENDNREIPRSTVSDLPTKNDTPVSTSPIENGSPDLGANPSSTSTDPAGPALTRAASKQRIDSMSPQTWLARYGSVRVGRTD